jgi:hypothetical protein
MDWSRIPQRFRNEYDLSAVRGDDGPRNAKCLTDGLGKLKREGAVTVSAKGPSDWRSVIRKHCEALNISLAPPETKRIVLKTKKFVNACLWRHAEKISEVFLKMSFTEGK